MVGNRPVSDLQGIVLDLEEAQYHARPELSSTEARLILDSPAKYRYKKDHPPLIEDSTKFDIGTAVHTKVLGTGARTVTYPPEHLTASGNPSEKKETLLWLAEQRAAGLVPVTPDWFAAVDAMAESVLAHKGAAQLFAQPADAEVSVFAQDPETGVDVRARFDFLPTAFTLGAPSRVAVDLKTALDASPTGFTKSIANYNYDTQRSWYLDTLRWATGEEAELVFVAVEKTAPYLVGVYQLPTIWAEMGNTKARKARQVYAECVQSGVWPGYGDDVQLLSPPTWLIFRHGEDYPNG